MTVHMARRKLAATAAACAAALSFGLGAGVQAQELPREVRIGFQKGSRPSWC